MGRFESRGSRAYLRGSRGRPSFGLSRILWVICIQQWYGLTDEAVEDAIYDT